MKLAINPTSTGAVTLNSFQGPSGRKFGAGVRKADRAGWRATAHIGRVEKWILKQVQDDDNGKGAHLADRHLALAMALALGTVMIGSPTATNAQTGAPDIAPIEQVVSDIEGGNREAAAAKISRVESLTGRPRMVTTAPQFVDRLLGCEGTFGDRRGFGGSDYVMIDVDWECADGATYKSILGREAGAPYVEVAEFSDLASYERYRATPVAPPRPPAFARTPEDRAQLAAAAELLKREQRVVLSVFSKAVFDGSLDEVADSVSPDTRFVYGWRDPFNDTDIVELDGEGLAAGREQLAHMIETLGKPTSMECKAEMFSSCSWRFAKPGRSLLALVHFRERDLRAVQFIYTTIDTLERAAKNATPDQLAEFQRQVLAEGSN